MGTTPGADLDEHTPWDSDRGCWIVDDSDPHAVVWIAPFLFTGAIILGPSRTLAYDDRWCYDNPRAALAAARDWLASGRRGEPQGWHRHPRSGRRRDANGTEWIMH